MPVVPFTAQRAHRQGPDLPPIDPTFLMMAAAELHEAGRLVEPIEQPKVEVDDNTAKS